MDIENWQSMLFSFRIARPDVVSQAIAMKGRLFIGLIESWRRYTIDCMYIQTDLFGKVAISVDFYNFSFLF